MKKRLMFCLLLCAALLLALTSGVYAYSGSYVAETAGLLGEAEAAALDASCAETSEKYGCAVYIVTLDDYRDFGNTVSEAAENIYTQGGLGLGDSGNCIMLLLSMDDRDYDLCAHGDLGNYAFTDYGKDVLADSFLGSFGKGDWYGGFEKYISTCDYFLECAQNGRPVDVPVKEEHEPTFAEKLPFIIIIPCVISALVCAISAARMKNAKRKYSAANYLADGGIDLRVRQDVFTHRTQSVQHIQRSNNSGGSRGSRGGTTVNIGGFSHKSGKF